MFSSMTTAQYADVFIDTTVPPFLLAITVILAAIGTIVIIASCFTYDGLTVFVIGALIIAGGFLIMGIAETISGLEKETVTRNIKANISEKYHAEVRTLTSEQTANLDKYRSYTLVFENGAVGDYQIKFEPSGEPVIGENPQSPSAGDLESNTKK